MLYTPSSWDWRADGKSTIWDWGYGIVMTIWGLWVSIFLMKLKAEIVSLVHYSIIYGNFSCCSYSIHSCWFLNQRCSYEFWFHLQHVKILEDITLILTRKSWTKWKSVTFLNPPMTTLLISWKREKCVQSTAEIFLPVAEVAGAINW